MNRNDESGEDRARRVIREIGERVQSEQASITERFNKPVSRQAAVVSRTMSQWSVGGSFSPGLAEAIAKAVLEDAGLKHEPKELKPLSQWKL